MKVLKQMSSRSKIVAENILKTGGMLSKCNRSKSNTEILHNASETVTAHETRKATEH